MVLEKQVETVDPLTPTLPLGGGREWVGVIFYVTRFLPFTVSYPVREAVLIDLPAFGRHLHPVDIDRPVVEGDPALTYQVMDGKGIYDPIPFGPEGILNTP